MVNKALFNEVQTIKEEGASVYEFVTKDIKLHG